ncbi:MAG: alpha/beta fold hydrolase [Halieaceae bacterium]
MTHKPGKGCRLTKSRGLHKSRFVASLVVCILSFSGAPATLSADHTDSSQGECVVLLHGLWRSSLSMKRVQWTLEEQGYSVANISYPSTSHNIETLAAMAVEQGVAECQLRHQGRISFVTHSLGGILLRQYLASQDIIGLRRVVMLAPPNQGSQMADYFQEITFLAPFEPEPLNQLGTGDKSIPLQLGPVSFELGIIAGNLNLRRYLPGAPEGVSDGTVSVAETVVPGMLDFLVMPVTHTFIMWDGEVLRQVVQFLRNGRFDRSLEAEA